MQRIPTGRKQTSWLFASVAEDLNSGTTCECECFVQRKRFYHPQGCLLLFRPNVDSLLLYQENRDFSKGKWGKETSKITKLRRHLPRNMNKLTCNLIRTLFIPTSFPGSIILPPAWGVRPGGGNMRDPGNKVVFIRLHFGYKIELCSY